MAGSKGATVDIRQVPGRLEPELVYMSSIQGQLFSKKVFGVEYIHMYLMMQGEISEFRTQTKYHS